MISVPFSRPAGLICLSWLSLLVKSGYSVTLHVTFKFRQRNEDVKSELLSRRRSRKTSRICCIAARFAPAVCAITHFLLLPKYIHNRVISDIALSSLRLRVRIIPTGRREVCI